MTTYEETKIDQTLERLEIPTTAAGRELSRAERVELLATRLARVENEQQRDDERQSCRGGAPAVMAALHARNDELARIGRLLDDAQVGDTLQPLTMRIQALLREHRKMIERDEACAPVTEEHMRLEACKLLAESALVQALGYAEHLIEEWSAERRPNQLQNLALAYEALYRERRSATLST